MYYELYIDSLFLLNFTLNLYVLLLTNKSLHCAATRRRILAGAMAGGGGYCLMFMLPIGGVVGKIFLVGIGLNGGILYGVFRPRNVRAFLKILETMLLYAMLMGGGFLLLNNHMDVVRKHGISLVGAMAAGGVLWLFCTFVLERKKDTNRTLCMVELIGSNNKKTGISALIDTGNCLVEPISQTPVSVVDKEVYEACFGKPEIFRAIPYRSVGCGKGIMEGVQIEELRVEVDGICKICKGVYIGLSDRPVSADGTYRMLLHPRLLEK